MGSNWNYLALQSSWQSFRLIMLNTPSQMSKYTEGVVLRMRVCIAVQRLSRNCVQKKKIRPGIMAFRTPLNAKAALSSALLKSSLPLLLEKKKTARMDSYHRRLQSCVGVRVRLHRI